MTSLRLVISQLREHLLELREVDETVAICINLCYHLVPHFILGCRILAKYCSDLLSLNSATSILVEEVEGGAHILLID